MARKNLTIRGNYALFWGQWPSNWEPSSFVSTSVVHHRQDKQVNTLLQYNCVEQYMMAEKARLFRDGHTERLIMATPFPAEQKRYGRGVQGYDEDQWAAVRYEVVLKGTLEKYRQNKALLEKLLDTGDLVLVEASPEDRVWGIGMRATDEGADDPIQWRGQNLLGKVIMEARTILREQLAAASP